MCIRDSSNTITIDKYNHGLVVGDTFVMANATTVGGIPASELNATHTVVAQTSDNRFTVTVTSNATSTARGGGLATTIDTAIVPTNPIETTSGSATIKVHKKAHGLSNNDSVTFENLVTVGGITLPEISQCSVLEALASVQQWRMGELDDTWQKLEREIPSTQTVNSTKKMDERTLYISKDIIKEIESRLRFLALVGLDYLTLDRRANTLSGGESQRIRLATQIGSELTGVLYILDEPSIGLHQRDNFRLINSLKELKNSNNSII